MEEGNIFNKITDFALQNHIEQINQQINLYKQKERELIKQIKILTEPKALIKHERELDKEAIRKSVSTEPINSILQKYKWIRVAVKPSGITVTLPYIENQKSIIKQKNKRSKNGRKKREDNFTATTANANIPQSPNTEITLGDAQ